MSAPTLPPSLTYDIFDPAYIADPFPIWDRLREQCPVAHSEEWGGSWMALRYQDVVDVAHDTEHFSSRSVTVLPRIEETSALLPEGSPPVTCDPPHHSAARRPLSSWFSPRRAAALEPFTTGLCRRLASELASRDHGDAAADYAQRIPVAVLGSVLGVDLADGDIFVRLVQDVMSSSDQERRAEAGVAIIDLFTSLVAARRDSPRDDLVSELLHPPGGGEPMSEARILGTVTLLLVAGIDTAACVLGSALWHLATHPADRRRLVEQPALLPLAVEEFLRAYAPATMGRIVTTDVEFGGCPMRQGDRMLLNFGSANRDPRMFPDADRVVLDRKDNRHIAFGAGIHRCVGAHLARMELRVGLREWLAAVPRFRLDPDAEVRWSGGQVRGPRSLPLLFS